jgi:hypothetical protein
MSSTEYRLNETAQPFETIQRLKSSFPLKQTERIVAASTRERPGSGDYRTVVGEANAVKRRSSRCHQ